MMTCSWLDGALLICVLCDWLMSSGVTASCEFPDFLQNGPDPYSDRWTTNMTEAGTLTNHAREHFIKVTGRMMRASVTGSIRYNRTCLRDMGDNTFLVSDTIQPGRSDDTLDNLETVYLCVKFIKRSPYVVSVHASDVSTEEDEGLCSDLRINVRPWIWQGQHEHIDCPAIGGFNLQLYDHDGEEQCHEYYNIPRIEFGCSARGYVDLGFKRCSKRNLVYQIGKSWIRAYCLGSWTEGDYSFVILRKMGIFAVWSIRYPSNPGNSFDAYIMSDVACETNEVITESKQYAKMHLTRKVISSSCEDSSDDCYMDPPEQTCTKMYSNNLGLHACRNVCRSDYDCTPGSKMECDFSDISGTWAPLTGPFNKMAFGSSADLAPLGNHYCENLRGRYLRSGEVRLVRYQDNGCFPRTYCFHYKQTASSVMFFKFAEGPTWPFYPAYFIGCEMDLFKPQVRDFPYTVTEFLPAIKYGNEQPQRCGIPDTGYTFDVKFVNDRFDDEDDETCKGQLTLPDCKGEASTEFKLTYTDCDNAALSGVSTYICLGEAPDIQGSERSLQLVKNKVSGSYTCFLFYHAYGRMYDIKEIPVEHCNDDGRYQYITVFDNINAYVPETCATTTRATTTTTEKNENTDYLSIYLDILQKLKEVGVSGNDGK